MPTPAFQMPNFLQFMRQKDIFGVPSLPGAANPMPNPIGGDMGAGVSNTPMDVGAMPPPTFTMPGIYAQDVSRQPNQEDPYDVSMGNIDWPPPAATQQFQPGPIPVAGEGMPDMGAGAQMRDMFKPQNDATKAFEDMIKNYPQAQDPSWLRRIGAMIVDYTKGHQQGQAFFNAPREQAIADWKNKIGPAQQAANLERYENANSRTALYNQMSVDLREKAQIAKEQNDEAKLKVLQNRADVYRFKAENPNYKFILPKGGNVQAFNPLTGQSRDTGIPTGSLSELDKINLGQEDALERIGATGDEARDTENLRQTGRLAAIGARGEEARKTRVTIPGGVSGQRTKTEQPTQTKVRQYNAAKEIANTNPELAKFIKFTGTNEFTIRPTGKGGWASPDGPTEQQAAELKRLIYGGPITYLENVNQTPLKSTEPGTIRVEVNGKTFRFKGTAQEAQAAGYKVIGQ